jgi:hypothetical protein
MAFMKKAEHFFKSLWDSWVRVSLKLANAKAVSLQDVFEHAVLRCYKPLSKQDLISPGQITYLPFLAI